jgi:hypothetical protein
MRSELIGWLGKVNRQFGYDIETFLLAINFVDRFLAVSMVSSDSLQLLGLAAILVAAKKVRFPTKCFFFLLRINE